MKEPARQGAEADQCSGKMPDLVYLLQEDFTALLSGQVSFYFESSFSSFRSSMALVIHLAPQQDPVGQEFLSPDPLKICS